MITVRFALSNGRVHTERLKHCHRDAELNPGEPVRKALAAALKKGVKVGNWLEIRYRGRVLVSYGAATAARLRYG